MKKNYLLIVALICGSCSVAPEGSIVARRAEPKKSQSPGSEATQVGSNVGTQAVAGESAPPAVTSIDLVSMLQSGSKIPGVVSELPLSLERKTDS